MRVPIRNGPSGNVDLAALQLHTVPSKQSLLVKVTPPTAPAADIEHVPCDIVLVIDVSTSMEDDAPVPGEVESTGLSVLDLTKHAALTIIETLNETDRLGIATFATRSTIVQTLAHMDDEKKEDVCKKIKALQPNGSTNLWHGIQDGIRVFNESVDTGNVRAMMVLTDGMPNHMCPQQGYIPKLKTLPPLPASLHTFGFGYGLRSGLLKSLAEYGHGNYAFIPDAGMIGTVFVHSVANLQSTFATAATLTLKYPATCQLEEVGETTVVKQRPCRANPASDHMSLEIPLGSLQFGQSRDIFLRVNNHGIDEEESTDLSTITATLSYQKTKTSSTDILEPPVVISAAGNVLATSQISEAEITYHESRSEICRFLSSMFPLGPDNEHRANLGKFEKYKTTLEALIATIPAKDFADAKNVSLMQDLCGPEPQGQISIAVNELKFLRKWGIHYLPSYSNAHSNQICNSFKDPGPLQYGIDSPLFIKCRDRLNDAFDNLPPPEPAVSREASSRGYGYGFSYGYGHGGTSASRSANTQRQPVSMSRYRNASGVCFAGSTPVELASGRMLHIRRLRRGMKVRTPTGMRKVAMVLKTSVQKETLCRVGSLLVTPWHPISFDGKTWDFPAFLAESSVRYTGFVYSIMLQHDTNLRSHALRVAGTWGVTLGHGITTGNDSRAHEFFGDYYRVGKSLVQLGVDKFGVVEGRGVDRDAGSGLVTGFKGIGPSSAGIRGAYGVPSIVITMARDVGVDTA